MKIGMKIGRDNNREREGQQQGKGGRRKEVGRGRGLKKENVREVNRGRYTAGEQRDRKMSEERETGEERKREKGKKRE